MHGGPSQAANLLMLGLTLEILSTNDQPKFENHNSPQKHAYELYQQQQRQTHQQKMIKNKKPQHFGKSSTPIQKSRGK